MRRDYAIENVRVTTTTHALAKLMMSRPSTGIDVTLRVQVIDASTMESSALTEGQAYIAVPDLYTGMVWEHIVEQLRK